MSEASILNATRWLWLLIAAIGALGVGCKRTSSAPASKPVPRAKDQWEARLKAPVQTEERYVLSQGLAPQWGPMHGLALDQQDQVLVAGDAGVAFLDPQGSVSRSWPASGPVRAVAVGRDGKVYAGIESRVEIYEPDGTLVTQWGDPGQGPGQLAAIRGIALSESEVFVADAGNRRILRFAINGDFINEIGAPEPGTPKAGIVCPSPFLDCVLDSQGVLHVPNPGHLCVNRYSKEGELLGSWGEAGMEPHQFFGCCNPTNLALFPDGRIVVSEKKLIRVKIYDAQGRLKGFIGSDQFSPAAEGMDLAVDSSGRIYVLDTGAELVRVFEREK